MLTLYDINHIAFQKSFGSGYKVQEVDAFIDNVAASYKALQDELEETKKMLEKAERGKVC